MIRRHAGALCALGVTLLALLALLPSTGGRGPEMDEGAVVAYAARVLDGAVPHRDFLTFYGPGNPWLVAGAFSAFGTSVGSERAVGLLYRLMILLALFVIARRIGGLVAAVLAGLAATTMMAVELIWAYATYGAIAFGLVGLALAAAGAAASPGRRQQLLLGAAGFAGGAAILVRFDFAPAVALGALPLLVYVPRRARVSYAIGVSGPLVAFGVHLVVVGRERIGRVLADLAASGDGRSLPVPRPWYFPGSLLALAVVVTGVLIVLGAVLWRRDGRDLTARLLVSTGVFNLALLPWSLSRPDPYHIRPLAIVPLSLVPALGLLGARSPRFGRGVRNLLVVAVAAFSLVAIVDHGGFDLDRMREAPHFRDGYHGFYDDDSIEATTAVVARVKRLAAPGDTLFVGPQDLRRTNYGPTYIYFLLRELRPASYYMEMNPGTANRKGSGLADELRRADWLILTSEWDDWDEPNASMDFGPSEPHDVVRDDFCLRLESGEYRLYERCDRV